MEAENWTALKKIKKRRVELRGKEGIKALRDSHSSGATHFNMSQGVKEAEVERILIMMNGGNEYQINERVFANNIHHISVRTCKETRSF